MRTKLIIDTDPGVDDAFAIALAARSPDVDLLGVTSVFGNVPLAATTRNAQRLLALCQRADVPVAAGAARPLVQPPGPTGGRVHGVDGLSGYADVLPQPGRELATADAVGLMLSLIESSDEPVTIAAIGPLTNVAALLAAHPHMRDKIDRVVIMGGALAHGNITAAAEFNIFSDPEAARRVLSGGEVPTVLVPMDLTYRCAVDSSWLEALAVSGKIGEALVALTPDYRAHYREALGWDGTVLHDAVAVAEAIRPGILDTDALAVDVECSAGPARGATVVDNRRPTSGRDVSDVADEHTVRVATDADLTGLREFVLDRLARDR